MMLAKDEGWTMIILAKKMTEREEILPESRKTDRDYVLLENHVPGESENYLDFGNNCEL